MRCSMTVSNRTHVLHYLANINLVCLALALDLHNALLRSAITLTNFRVFKLLKFFHNFCWRGDRKIGSGWRDEGRSLYRRSDQLVQLCPSNCCYLRCTTCTRTDITCSTFLHLPMHLPIVLVCILFMSPGGQEFTNRHSVD